MLLEGKNAIIYGAAGGLGSGVARTFAREGARVFVTGRTRETLDALVGEITHAGGKAEAAVVDALDEGAVDEHARGVVSRAGSLDVSFNLISRGDVQRIPLVDMTTDDLTRATITGLSASFNTARAAARLMSEQGAGVILHLTSGSARGGAPMMGSTGPADAASEALMRYLAVETGPHAVRVLGINTAGVPETLTREKLEAVGGETTPSPEQVDQMIAGMTMLRCTPRLAEVADVAAFLASDRARAMTATIVNVSCGLIHD